MNDTGALIYVVDTHPKSGGATSNHSTTSGRD